jgi:hypothetical protein
VSAPTLVSGNRGTGTAKSVGITSFTITPNATLVVDHYLLLTAALDNVSTTGGDTTQVSVTDTQGNTWVRVKEYTATGGGAADGVTGAMFLCLVETELTTSDTITVSFPSINAAGGAISEWSVAGGNEMNVADAVANSGTAATSYSLAISGLTSADYEFVGLSIAENEVSTAVTPDSAYTAMASGFGSGTSGGNATNVIGSAAHLTASGVTGDTFDRSSLTSSDRATLLIALSEDTPGGGTISGTGAVVAGGVILDADGAEIFTGSAALVAGGIILDGDGAEVFSGSAAITAAGAVLDADGIEKFIASGGVVMGGAILDGDGINTDPPSGDITGSGGVIMAPIILDGDGAEILSGSGAIVAAAAVLDGDGVVANPISGSGAIVVAAAVLDGDGQIPVAITGSGSIVAAAAVLGGAARYHDIKRDYFIVARGAMGVVKAGPNRKWRN